MSMSTGAAKRAALQTAHRTLLTCADISLALCFGTHLAQTPCGGFAPGSSGRAAEYQPPRDPLLAKYAHVVAYRRWPGIRPPSCPL
jgi:hypothetical protein